MKLGSWNPLGGLLIILINYSFFCTPAAWMVDASVHSAKKPSQGGSPRELLVLWPKTKSEMTMISGFWFTPGGQRPKRIRLFFLRGGQKPTRIRLFPILRPETKAKQVVSRPEAKNLPGTGCFQSGGLKPKTSRPGCFPTSLGQKPENQNLP